jgi:polysaccharide biosynthesis transport protein
MDQTNPNHFPQRGSERAVAVAPNRVGVPDEYRYQGHAYPNFPIDSTAHEETGFDFYKYVRILLKYRWLIAGVVGACLVLATVLTYLSTPIYRATSSIQIDREAMSVVTVGGLQKGENTGQEFFQTEYELLGSRSLAERVVSTLGLVDDPSFSRTSGTPGNESIFGLVKSLVLGPSKRQVVPKTLDEKTRSITDALVQIMSIAPVRGSRLVKINIDHTNPAEALKIANGVAEVFIQDNLDRRYDASSYARKFLEERIVQLKVKLEESEKGLVKYAEDQGIINLDDNKKTLAGTDLENINKKLSEARNERLKLELLWNRAQNTQGFGLQQILDSKAIQDNRRLRAELAAQYQQKLAQFKPAFPAMIELRNQIQELDRQVITEVKSIKDSIYSQYAAAKSQEEDLVGQLETTKGEVVDQRNRSIQYNILQREVDTNRTLYDGLLQRYKEIGVSGAVGTNNISVVDHADLPLRPRSPNLTLNLMLGLISGLLLGILTALGLDYLDDSFKAPEDVEREVGLSVIGVVPKPPSGQTIDDELMDQRSSVAEAVRSLRTGLQFATADGLPKTLLITSSKPAEGKTTTTIALAKSLANIGLNVLLIDGDLRNASVHRHLRCSNELGLSNYLTGAKMPEEVVQGSTVEGLVVMASGPLPPNPAELLAGPKLLSLLTLSAESFDVVLIDGPPVMGLADAPLLASLVQSTLMVIAANETRRSVVKVALRRLRMARANIIGSLLTKFDASQTGYGYGYGYGDYEYHSYGTKELPAPQR